MERRRHTRQYVKIAATAVAEGGLDRVSVTITNITAAGARVEWTGTTPPAQFYMLFGNSMEPCRIVWSQGTAAGLAFTAAEVVAA